MKHLWYKNAIIYSLDVETFMDSDGDGVGDFTGLTQPLRLPIWVRNYLLVVAAVLSLPKSR